MKVFESRKEASQWCEANANGKVIVYVIDFKELVALAYYPELKPKFRLHYYCHL